MTPNSTYIEDDWSEHATATRRIPGLKDKSTATSLGGAAVNRGFARGRFEAICRSLRPDLYRFAYWIARDRAVAEDVVQETMLRAWKSRESLKDEAAAKSWLLTIVRREYARTFERKRLAMIDVDVLVDAESPMLGADDEHDLDALRAAILKLPEEYRQPLVLQALMGFSTAEIAAELKLSTPAVLTRVFRARKRLRTLCGEDTSSDPEDP